jgi:hypothetical protein
MLTVDPDVAVICPHSGAGELLERPTARGYGPVDRCVHLLVDHRELVRERGRPSAAGNGGGNMTAIVIREDAQATWPTGMAGVRVRACDMVQRAIACAAATIMV